jgi:hypothetical protein
LEIWKFWPIFEIIEIFFSDHRHPCLGLVVVC